jgi:hypothetical protein
MANYTATVFGKKYRVKPAVVFWGFVGVTALYISCLYAAFMTIGLFAILFLTIQPITINNVNLNPWPNVVTYLLWLVFIANGIAFACDVNLVEYIKMF